VYKNEMVATHALGKHARTRQFPRTPNGRDAGGRTRGDRALRTYIVEELEVFADPSHGDVVAAVLEAEAAFWETARG
jgi:hypothetical protein